MRLDTITGACLCVLFLSSPLFFTGCAQVPISTAPTSIGQQSNVGLIEEGERVHLDDKITAEDMIALASKVTEKMLISAEVQTWGATGKRPLLVIAVPENTTHDANIITEDLQDEIISKVLDSGVARAIDESSVSSNYDYTIKTTITSTTQSGNGGSKVTYYTCKLQLFTMRGERVGQWHDKVGMAKAPRSFF